MQDLNEKLWFLFDVETTHLKPKKGGITELGAILYDPKKDKVLAEFDLKINPFTYNRKKMKISPEAMKIQGIKKPSELKKGRVTSSQAFKQITKTLRKYVNPYTKGVNVIPIGYNSSTFDIPWLKKWFADNDSKASYYGFLSTKDLDVFQYVKLLDTMGYMPKLEDHKLATVAKYFGIKIEAHKAISDIKATAEILNCCLDLMNLKRVN